MPITILRASRRTAHVPFEGQGRHVPEQPQISYCRPRCFRWRRGSLQHVFSHMPPDSSMVFVVVTHLNAGQESQLAALIGYRTQVQVCQVGHGMKVGPDHVYVIRPLKRPTFAKATEII
jgi:hypothetical protein